MHETQLGIAVGRAPRAPFVTVSLDQNALCFMAPRAGATISNCWSAIRALLIAGVDAGKVVCPLPPETVWESALLQSERYERVRALQSRLSAGIAFKPFSRVLAEETLALIRPGADVTPFVTRQWDAQLAAFASRSLVLRLKDELEQRLAMRTVKFGNEKLSFAELERVIHLKYTADLYRSLRLIQAGKLVMPTCPYTLDVCEFLRANAASGGELEELKELARHHKYTSIPVLFYYIRLMTQFEFDLLRGGRRQEGNDVDDLTRVASALWASDIYVCDKEMADVCRKTKIQELTHTRVFGANQADQFRDYIATLV